MIAAGARSTVTATNNGGIGGIGIHQENPSVLAWGGPYLRTLADLASQFFLA